MLIVDLELRPGGLHLGSHSIGRAGVANLSGQALAPVSDYLVVVRRVDGTEHRFLVTGHRRDDGAWELLRRIAVELDRPARLALPAELDELADLIAAEL